MATRQRRPKGEGSIYKLTDGTYRATVHLGWGTDGKRKTKTFRAKTEKEALARLKEAQRDLDQGLDIAASSQPVKRFLTDWLEQTAKPTLRVSTYTGYELHVRKHLIPALGKIPLNKLKPQDVQALMNAQLASGLSPETVKYTRSVLRRALSYAMRWGLLGRNVAALVDPPHSPRRTYTIWTVEEAQTFLESLRGHRLEALYTVAFALALRRGEALGLRWEDVDFKAGTLSINQTVQRVAGKLRIEETKTQSSTRTIKLPRVIVQALRAHKVRQTEERVAAKVWRDTGFVFTSSVGTPIEPRNLNRDFALAIERAGVPRIRVHDLRHTAATLLLAQGLPIKEVSELLGHASTRITQEIYIHGRQDGRDLIADTIDRLFGP